MAKKKGQKKIQKKWLQVLQFLAAYLVAAWTFLQFVDWALIRYSISPYWVDMLLWLFIGIIPSLVIYLYHRERINNKILRLREKIIFPLNLIILVVGLYIGFGTSDLGATTKEVEITNKKGEIENIRITKEEFRTILPVFNFSTKNKDSSILWLEGGIRDMLYFDLSQDKRLTVERSSATNTADKITVAKLNSENYVDGSFDKNGDTYTVDVNIRSSKNGKVRNTRSFSGTDVLNLIDEISIYIKQETVSAIENSYQYLDLDVKEHLSESLPALKSFVSRDYEGATEVDSTFARAYLEWLKLKLHFNQGSIDAKNIANKAYQNKGKLPYDDQKEVQLYHFLAYEQWNAAEELVKMQLDISPQNRELNTILYRIYGSTKNTTGLVKHAEDQYNAFKSSYNIRTAANALLINGEYDRYIDELTLYMRLNPFNDNIFPMLLRPQILKGDYDSAQATLDKIHLYFPNNTNENKVFDTALEYLKKNKGNLPDVSFFEGEYRGQHSEIITSFWAEDERLLCYFSNQIIVPLLIGGPKKLVRGEVNQETIEIDFVLNEEGKPYLIQTEQNNGDYSRTNWLWKLDDFIKKAEEFLLEGKYIEAERAYKAAIEKNPKHFYLKDALKHIQYVKNIDSLRLKKQYEQVLGTYSIEENELKRNFWLKNGRLYYKREGLPSKELLPISETRYMNMSEPQFNYEFEYKNGEVLACFAWFFNPETMTWENFNPDLNYLYKE